MGSAEVMDAWLPAVLRGGFSRIVLIVCPHMQANIVDTNKHKNITKNKKQEINVIVRQAGTLMLRGVLRGRLRLKRQVS